MVQTIVRSNRFPDSVTSVWEHRGVPRPKYSSDHSSIWVWTKTWVKHVRTCSVLTHLRWSHFYFVSFEGRKTEHVTILDIWDRRLFHNSHSVGYCQSLKISKQIIRKVRWQRLELTAIVKSKKLYVAIRGGGGGSVGQRGVGTTTTSNKNLSISATT